MQIIIGIIILVILFQAGASILAYLNMETEFYIMTGISLAAFVVLQVLSSKQTEEEKKTQYKGMSILAFLGVVAFGLCGFLTQPAINHVQSQNERNEKYEAEQKEKKRIAAEKENAQEEEKAKREQERQAEEQAKRQNADEDVKAWCGRMRSLMDDTQEQWDYWWPRATQSGNIAVDYDAANTLALNLEQYFSYFHGDNYQIPYYASDYRKSQMKKIESAFSNALNKRRLAAEKYASGLKKGNFDLDDAAGIRRRAEEAQQSHTEAIRLLQELEAELGI